MILAIFAFRSANGTKRRRAFEIYFKANPDDAEIEHLLIALKDETPPERASDRTIQKIYKDFAWSYETRMRDDLEYKGPERLFRRHQSGDWRALGITRSRSRLRIRICRRGAQAHFGAADRH